MAQQGYVLRDFHSHLPQLETRLGGEGGVRGGLCLFCVGRSNRQHWADWET